MKSLLVRAAALSGVLALCPSGFGADIEVPFDLMHNQIVLQVSVKGGGPYNFVLDTGTHASTIDLRLAKRLGLPLVQTESMSRGAGARRVVARSTVLPQLKIGALSVADLAAAALDLSPITGQMGRPLHGVLGHGFLASRITVIDYFRRRIRFLNEPPQLLPDGPQGISFPMQTRAGEVLPLLEDCYINEVRVPVTLDTGSSLGLILFPLTVRKLGLEDLARSGIPMDAAGYRGSARLTKGWVRSIKLKELDLGAIEVAYARSGYGERELPESRGGNLGNAVLQDFVLTLDYVNRLVLLQRAVD